MEDVPVGISLIYIISNNLINRRRGFNRALKREREREIYWKSADQMELALVTGYRELWCIHACTLGHLEHRMQPYTPKDFHAWPRLAIFFFFSLAKSIDEAKRKRIYSIGLSIIFKLYLVSYWIEFKYLNLFISYVVSFLMIKLIVFGKWIIIAKL